MKKIYEGKGGFLAELVHGQTVKFYPTGGGFQIEILLERFIAEFKEVEPNRDLVPGWFAIDGGERYPGYHRRERWNGWAMPYFEFKVALAVMDRWKGSGNPLRYSEAADSFLWTYEEGEEPEVYKGELVQIDGKDVKVYGVGAGSWVWDCYETEGDE